MTTTHLEVTLEQLLQMALGTPQITNLNLSILHSFFDIILKKIGCQYEKVELDGLDGSCLEKILHKSRVSPLPFNIEQIALISEKVEQLTKLQQYHKKLENALREHMAYIRSCQNKGIDRHNNKDWEKYCQACESLCTTQKALNCKLVKNYYFIKKIKQFVEEPLIGPIIDMRRHLEFLHVEIIDYHRRLTEQCERLAIIDVLADQIEKLSRAIAIEEKSFMGAMVELQDMIDGKMYKVVLPALKKYIQTETDKINEICRSIKKKPTCQSNKLFSGGSGGCLSCTGKLTCTQRPIMIAPKKPEKVAEGKKRKIAKACSRFGPCLSKHTEEQLLERLKVTEDATEEAKVKREMKQSCFKPSGNLELFRGYDGVYYRKA